MQQQRPSITAFFPCYNDELTIADMVLKAGETLRQISDDFEVVVINDGSQDGSARALAELQRTCPYLRVITHEANRGYGGALRSGFGAARKELVFYTDGDAQYDPAELLTLYELLTPDVDVVQGWKIQRHDAFYRRVIGRAYHQVMRLLFNLHVRDVDCDFRLIRRRVLESFPLTSDSGSITVELMARIEREGWTIREVGVNHYARPYGSSQFFSFGRIAQTFWQLAGIWLRLHFEAGEQEAVLPAISVQAE
jgi:glycosyltransferase involved in cell wall biosynthesis